ncbi:MAG: hypothetical protein HQK51_03595 [Oligoflexia bacterium]|nr:hypothetical protein [Oligoflexia bacterium]
MRSFCQFLHLSIIWIIVYQLLLGLLAQNYIQIASANDNPAASFDEYIEKASESGIEKLKKEADDKFKECLKRDPANEFSGVCCNKLEDKDKIDACRTAIMGINLYQSCSMGLREEDTVKCCEEANSIEANMCRSIIKDIRQCKHEIENYGEGAKFTSETSSSGACCNGAKLFLTGTKIVSSNHDFIKNVKCPSLDVTKIATDKLNIILNSDVPPVSTNAIIGKTSKMSADILLFLYDYYKLEMEERHLCTLQAQPTLQNTYKAGNFFYSISTAGSWLFFLFWIIGVVYKYFKILGYSYEIPVINMEIGDKKTTNDQATIENADITSEESRKNVEDLSLGLLQSILFGFMIKESITVAGYGLSSILFMAASVQAMLLANSTPAGAASPFISQCTFDKDILEISPSDNLLTELSKKCGKFVRGSGNGLLLLVSKFFRYFWMVLKVVQTLFFGASMFTIAEKNKGVTFQHFLVIAGAELVTSILAVIAKTIASITGGKKRDWKAKNETLGDKVFATNYFPVVLLLLATTTSLLTVSSLNSLKKMKGYLETIKDLRAKLRGMTTPQQICWALGIPDKHIEKCGEHAKIIPCIINNNNVEDQFKCCTETIDSNLTKGSCLGLTMGVKSTICAVGVKIAGKDINSCCSHFKDSGNLRPLCEAVTKSSEICKGTDTALDCCEKEAAKFPALRESVKKSCEVANQASDIEKCQYILKKSDNIEMAMLCCTGIAEEDKRIECFKKIPDSADDKGQEETQYPENCLENRSDSIAKIKKCCQAKKDSAVQASCLRDLDEHVKRLFSSKYNGSLDDVKWDDSEEKSKFALNFFKNIQSYILDQMFNPLLASQASNISENKVCVSKNGNMDINCTCLEKNNCLKFDKRDMESFEKLGFSKKLQKKYEIFMKSMNKMSEGDLPVTNFDFQNIFDIQKETFDEIPEIMKKNKNLEGLAYSIEKKLPEMVDRVLESNKEKISENSANMSSVFKTIGSTSSNGNIGSLFNKISQEGSIDSIKKKTIDSSTQSIVSPPQSIASPTQSIDSSNAKSMKEKYIFNSINPKKDEDIWKIISKKYFLKFYSK